MTEYGHVPTSSGGQTNVPRRDVTSRRRDELAIGILVNVSSQAGETRRDETTQPKSNPCPTREFGELRELVYFIFSYFIYVCLTCADGCPLARDETRRTETR